ncbi:hypothetical protein OIU34_14305 [Pararhizobium sp. BT-229]|uniref:hypothetical protein n=1 Tax=Pararhizobium sp. BT-229 TaxID=2986923 RepID=UPI0021F78DCA|nr:hypothetical protein [Pararhizobium sp. BT-229]MCV9963078.1 hypothetical protein [Pararhizobium sp. BT-229]
MRVKSLMAAAAIALLTLSGCASTGAGNTTYSQWQGAYPQPDFSASSPGGVRMSY